MGNKVLVTGLGNGILGECSPCNYDAYQLICNPSMLLWIDKIIIPQKILNTIRKNTTDAEGKIVQLIIEFYERAGLIEPLNTDSLFTPEIQSLLEDAVERDVEALTAIDPQLAKVEDDSHFVIRYKEVEYCYPKLLSLYGDLFLAKEVSANCLFSPRSIDYCNLKFGLTAENPANGLNALAGVDKVLKTIIPDIHPLPMFLYNGERCQECAKNGDCQKRYYTDLSGSLEQYLEWRDYDEFFELRDCLNKVISETKKYNGLIMPDDIVESFEKKKKHINTMLHRHLPKVKKFSDLVAAISVPATLVSAAAGASLPLSVGAASIAGVSTLTSVAVDQIEEKYKWVNFSLKQTEHNQSDVCSKRTSAHETANFPQIEERLVLTKEYTLYILIVKGVETMYVTLQRWGNSQGIRIPKVLLDAVGLRENDRVELVQDKDSLTVKKAAAVPHRTLEERLTAFYGKPIEQIERLDDHEVDWGSAQGVEEW